MSPQKCRLSIGFVKPVFLRRSLSIQFKFICSSGHRETRSNRLSRQTMRLPMSSKNLSWMNSRMELLWFVCLFKSTGDDEVFIRTSVQASVTCITPSNVWFMPHLIIKAVYLDFWLLTAGNSIKLLYIWQISITVLYLIYFCVYLIRNLNYFNFSKFKFVAIQKQHFKAIKSCKSSFFPNYLQNFLKFSTLTCFKL